MRLITSVRLERGRRQGLWLAVAIMSLGLPRLAAAALGADATSVEADKLQMRGTLRTSTAGLYTVHEIQGPSGTVVREFVSPAGIVFAIAWKGPFLPDLRQALGAYFEPYRTALGAKRASHTHADIDLPELVVHSGGHQRAFIGQAYLPRLLPSGVAASDLR
jgi:hypothetical protein